MPRCSVVDADKAANTENTDKVEDITFENVKPEDKTEPKDTLTFQE